MRVAAGHRHGLRGHGFRQAIGKLRRLRQQNLSHPGDPRSRLGHGLRIPARDQYVDRHVQPARGSNGVERGAIQRPIIVFGNNKDSHQITLASFFSLSTSAATSATLMPGARAAGSSTRSVCRRDTGSTPSASGVSTSRGFFLAFMMLGNVT